MNQLNTQFAPEEDETDPMDKLREAARNALQRNYKQILKANFTSLTAKDRALMSEIANQETTSNSSLEPIAKNLIKTPDQNPAVTRCMKVWNRVYKETPKAGPRINCDDDYIAVRAADEAFRAAMPNLIGIDNIRDFIACIAYGMLNNTIDHDLGTKLLYAAQVAFSTTTKNQASVIPPAG